MSVLVIVLITLLIGALVLYDKGDLELEDMVGAWAGEIGHTQFLPKEYNETAVDFDGDGHRNLKRSIPDAMASSAALLIKHGWQPNQPWLQEVSVPKDMPASEVEKLALADEDVVRFLAGQPVKKIIVVPQRIVNVVA